MNRTARLTAFRFMAVLCLTAEPTTKLRLILPWAIECVPPRRYLVFSVGDHTPHGLTPLLGHLPTFPNYS